jgi:tetratricopeptide (TPR) repeat protein
MTRSGHELLRCKCPLSELKAPTPDTNEDRHNFSDQFKKAEGRLAYQLCSSGGRMRRLRIIICTIIFGVIPVAALAAAGETSGCVRIVIGTDKAAIINACTELLEQTGLSPEERAKLLMYRGHAFRWLDNNDAAARDFDAAIALTPNDVEPLLRRGETAARVFERTADEEQLKTAVDFARQALAIDPKESAAYDLLGMAAGMGKDFKLAKVLFDKALELAPNSVVIHHHRFYLYKMARANDWALKELDEMLKLPGSDLDTLSTWILKKEISYRTLVYYQRAEVYKRMGRYEDALKSYSQWIEVEPAALSYGMRATLYLQMSQYDQAQSDLDKAFSYDPHFWFLHNTQGGLYFYTERYDRAVQSFTQAIAELPPSGMNYWGRALAFRALKHSDEAINDALKAVDDPEFANSVINRVSKAGYFKISSSQENMMRSLRDAVRACMLDERC